VIEGRAQPTRRVVTDRAITRETGLYVVRVRRPVKVLHMTAIAICRRPFEAASNVACCACERGMHSRQSKACELQVVELCVEPGISRMAGLAGCGEVQGFVIRLRGLLIVGCMTGKAGCGKACELAHRFSFVAVSALQQGVCTQQWKAVLMLLDLLGLDLPALHRVTLLTIGPELAPVDICVAIRTTHAHVGKDKIGMAPYAVHFFVHPSQRVARPVVVKLRNVADGLPASIGMAVLAGNVDGAMRVPPGLLIRLRQRRHLPDDCDGQEQEHEANVSCRVHGTHIPSGFQLLGWRQEKII